MDTPTAMESFTNGEEALRSQLSIYKSLNNDLSKKIQKLKIEVNNHAKEINKVQEELIEERNKSAELRRLFMSANSHCISFYKSYFDIIQQVNEIQDVSFETAADNNISQTTIRPIVRGNNHWVNAGHGDLARITEESSSAPRQTSTPVHSSTTFQRNIQLLRRSLDSFLLPPEEPSIIEPSINEASSHVTERHHSKNVNSHDDDDESSSSADESPVKKSIRSHLEEMKECVVDITKMKTPNHNRETEESYEEEEGSKNSVEKENSKSQEETGGSNDVNESSEEEEVITVKANMSMKIVVNENESDNMKKKETGGSKEIDESSEEEEVTTAKTKKSKKNIEKDNSSDNKSRDEKQEKKSSKNDKKESSEEVTTVKIKSKKIVDKENSSDNKEKGASNDLEESIEEVKTVKAKSKKIVENSSDNKSKEEKKPPKLIKLKKAVKRKVEEETQDEQQEEKEGGRPTRQKRRPNYIDGPLNAKMRRDD